MSVEKKNSFLYKTNQIWKFYLASSYGFVIYLIWRYYKLKEIEEGLVGNGIFIGALLFLVAGVIIFCFLLFGLQCPSCRLKVGFYYFKKSRFSKFFEDLLTFKICPRCSYDPSQPDV